MLNYLGIFIPGIAAMIGVLTKDNTKNKILKVLSKKWVTVGLIGLGLLIAIIQAARAERIKIQSEESINRVKKAVYDKIEIACYLHVFPFKSKFPDSKPFNSLKDQNSIFSLLQSQEFDTILYKVFTKPDTTFIYPLSEFPKFFDFESLKDIQTRYLNYLDPDEIILIDSITNNEYIRFLRQSVDDMKQNRFPINLISKKSKMPPSDLDLLIELHNDYFSQIQRLYKRAGKY